MRRNLQIEENAEAEVDNSLRDRHYPSQHTKAEFNNCFTTHPKHFYS